jgi:hypothetical protein
MVRQAHHPEPGRRANTNDQNSKFKTSAIVAAHLLSDREVSVIGISDLDIIWDLGFDNWDFRFVFRKVNYFYLSQLESSLTLPCPLSVAKS